MNVLPARVEGQWWMTDGDVLPLAVAAALVCKDRDWQQRIRLACDPSRTFADYTRWWFDRESDIYSADEVRRLVQEHPHLAKDFHTEGWVPQLRGFTFFDLLCAEEAQGVCC